MVIDNYTTLISSANYTLSDIHGDFSNQVDWSAAIVVAIGSLIGGLLGGKLARIISPSYLRWTVVILSIITATVYFLR